MAAVETPRFGIYTWPFGTDPFTRDQMNQSHQRLESLAAKFLSGPIGDRPEAGDKTIRTFYLASDTSNTDNVLVLYYCDGTRWFSINDFDAPEQVFPGQAQSEGASVYSARADHVHETPPWGATNELQTIKTVATAGSAVSFARVDHVHVLGTGSVAATHIQDGAINATAKLVDGIITTPKLVNDAVTRGKIAPSERMPVGSVIPFAGQIANVPTGWLPAHGASVSRAEYASLFAVLGTWYGSVSIDTFTLPDLRGVFVCGVNDAEPGAKSLNVRGGTDTRTLVAANLPWHQHPIDHNHGQQATYNDGSHQHAVKSIGGLGSGENSYGLGLLSSVGAAPYITETAGLHAHAFDVDPYYGPSGNNSTGTSTPIDIRPPFIHLNYIIKT
jgi:microcystin-dependent protein